VRVYTRMSRHSGISLGPVALLLLSPFLVMWFLCYAVIVLVVVLVRAVAALIDAHRA
jgi:hypothetical protein